MRGFLIVRSQYLPKWLGILVIIAGLGFVTKTYTFVLTPDHSSQLFLLPMFVAMLAMTVWFLTKGVDVAKWEAKSASQEAHAAR